MFDFFKTLKEENSRLNESKKALDDLKPDWVPQPEPERQYYSLGPTTEGRVMLKLHYGIVSMDRDGIDSLIQVLEASKVWLEDKSGKQPDNGCQVEE